MSLLVTTHEGEFWPFSIFPMFSRGGHPWIRSHVRQVELRPGVAVWATSSDLYTLPGSPYPLREAGVNQNDIANFLFKTDSWSGRRVNAMRALFGSDLESQNLMIYRVDGSLDETGSVNVVATPFLLLTPDSTHFNPRLEYPGR